MDPAHAVNFVQSVKFYADRMLTTFAGNPNAWARLSLRASLATSLAMITGGVIRIEDVRVNTNTTDKTLIVRVRYLCP